MSTALLHLDYRIAGGKRISGPQIAQAYTERLTFIANFPGIMITGVQVVGTEETIAKLTLALQECSPGQVGISPASKPVR